MKKIYLLVATLLLTTVSFSQAVFINEIHYDNAGTDVGEAVEIAGPAGTDLSGYSVIGYNGNNGEEYNSISLSGTIPNQDDGYGTLSFDFTGMQNGAPDGLVLYDGTTVIQFLSYEGSFTAVGGVANGLTSVDIGVVEIGTPEGESLQLGGAGTDYSNFTWQESQANTMGSVNTNQDFGGAPQPALSIVFPYDGAFLNPEMTAFDATFTVTNFNVANSGGDGYIKYSVDGAASQNHYTTDPIALSGLASGTHTFYMELVDNSGNVLSPEVNDQVAFEIASYTDVADLAALRAGTQGDYYRVTGEVFGTFAQSYRNQKWVQDSSAGMKIDDNNGVITTVYNEGDGVINLRGRLTSYNDVLQLIPTADPGLNSSGNTITPEVITLSQLTSKNLADYESELVQIFDVTITDISGGDGTFQPGESYEINDGTASILRTDFHDADYIGTNLPATAMAYTCIVGGYNGTPQVTPRDIGDILSVDQQNLIEGFSLYPNPVTNGVISITTDNNLEKNIQIFNVLGKQVFAQTTSKTTIDISNLTSGIYIINVEENKHFATRKLVIK